MSRRAPLTIDGLLVLGALTVVVSQLGGRWPTPVVATAAAAWVAALLVRRRLRFAPLAGPVALVTAARLDATWTPSVAVFCSIVLAGGLVGWSGARMRPARTVLDASALVVVTWSAVVVLGRQTVVDAAYLGAFGLGALVGGRFAARVARRVDAERERLTAVEAERDGYVRRTAAQERERLAAELHDLVGHSVGAMTLQAGAARLKLEAGDTEAAREALLAVETAGHAALVDLRHMLGLLRRDMTEESQ